MEKEKEDDDCGDGAIYRSSLVSANVEEPEEERGTDCDEREKKVDEEIDVGILNSLIS